MHWPQTARLPGVEPLVDSWGREIKSLRVSVTDKCNFRCRYCMPAEGLEWLERDELLSFEEMARLVRLLASMGVEEVRLTGGEPLVRRDLPVLVELLSGIDGVNDLSLTTNGVLLDRLAKPLVDAGLTRLERLARLALARALHGDHAARRARPRARGPRGGRALSAAAADQGQLRRDAWVHGGRGARARRARAPQALRRALHRVHAARRRRVVARRRGAHRRRDPRPDRGALAARGDPREGLVDGAPVPLRRRKGRDRVRQPGLGAVLLELRPDPAHGRRPAPDVPLLAEGMGSQDPAAGGRHRRASSRRFCASRYVTRSSSTGSTSPASCALRAP